MLCSAVALCDKKVVGVRGEAEFYQCESRAALEYTARQMILDAAVLDTGLLAGLKSCRLQCSYSCRWGRQAGVCSTTLNTVRNSNLKPRCSVGLRRQINIKCTATAYISPAYTCSNRCTAVPGAVLAPLPCGWYLSVQSSTASCGVQGRREAEQ